MVTNDRYAHKKRRRNVMCVACAAFQVTVLAIALASYAGGQFDAPVGGDTTQPVHFYFLLDRSGSMSRLHDNVVEGMNGYVADMIREHQDSRENDPELMMTLVQFDSVDPHEITHDALRLSDVPTWTHDDFSPRGRTPLFDAIGAVVKRAERRESKEDTVVIILTDGMENASSEYDKETVASLIASKKRDGWAFVFLGANIDAFDVGSEIMLSARSTQNFHPDKAGVQKAFASLSKSSLRYARAATSPAQKARYAENFFEGHNDAQHDFESRDLHWISRVS